MTEAVGDVIEFWGFKRNQGRVWALLYLHDEPMSARQIREHLQLSKGAVSMITSELREWEIIDIVEPDDSRARLFAANADFFSMITRVLRRREQNLIERVAIDLDDAYRLAKMSDDVDEATIRRLDRLRRLAGFMQQALETFLENALFDAGKTREIL